jgi:hypothetical protein
MRTILGLTALAASACALSHEVGDGEVVSAIMCTPGEGSAGLAGLGGLGGCGLGSESRPAFAESGRAVTLDSGEVVDYCMCYTRCDGGCPTWTTPRGETTWQCAANVFVAGERACVPECVGDDDCAEGFRCIPVGDTSLWRDSAVTHLCARTAPSE